MICKFCGCVDVHWRNLDESKLGGPYTYCPLCGEHDCQEEVPEDETEGA